MYSPLNSALGASGLAGGADSRDTRVTPSTMRESVRHLRTLTGVPSINTAKKAVASTLSWEMAVNTEALMRSRAG